MSECSFMRVLVTWKGGGVGEVIEARTEGQEGSGEEMYGSLHAKRANVGRVGIARSPRTVAMCANAVHLF